MTHQTENPARQDPEKAASDLGPLPWLCELANVGVDDRQPGGPMERLVESRFLGLDDTHRGYALDPGQRRTVEPVPGWGDFIYQMSRGIRKRWLRPAPDSGRFPFPESNLGPMPSPETLRRWLAEHPPRAIMPIPDGELSWWIPCEGGEPREPGVSVVRGRRIPLFDEEAVDRWRVVRDVAHAFLHGICGRKTGTDMGFSESVIRLYLQLIRGLCLGQVEYHPLSPPARPEAAPWDESDQWAIFGLKTITYIISENRAPVSLWTNGPLTAPELYYVSSVMPGIVWAEVLNLAERPPLWDLLRCCGWCGRFFSASPRGPGRPREFCSPPCKARFHDRAPGETRSYKKRPEHR